jgi:hypothetical protein
MPRCATGSRRCPPRVGKCHKSGKTAKKHPKLKKSVKNTPAVLDSPMQKRTWIEHLKWCSNKFDIKYGKAMTDTRCRKIWKDTH